MPVIQVSDLAVLAANVGFWVVTFLVVGWIGARPPARRLQHDGPLLRIRRVEDDGRLYQRWLRIHRWKDRLPEAGAAFGGASKRNLPPGGRHHLEAFAAETRRAERVHWWSLIPLPLTVIWNPPAGVALMVLFGLAFNLPFIVIQRFNRARIERILRRRGRDRGPYGVGGETRDAADGSTS